MGLFRNPKCPRCGGKTVQTGYAFPFPPLRCNRCVTESAQREKDQKKIQELEDRLRKIENQKKQ